MDNQQIQPPDIHHPMYRTALLDVDYIKSVAAKKKEVVGSYPCAAVFLVHQPKWFQRLYTLMVQNVVNNLPGMSIFASLVMPLLSISK